VEPFTLSAAQHNAAECLTRERANMLKDVASLYMDSDYTSACKQIGIRTCSGSHFHARASSAKSGVDEEPAASRIALNTSGASTPETRDVVATAAPDTMRLLTWRPFMILFIEAAARKVLQCMRWYWWCGSCAGWTFGAEHVHGCVEWVGRLPMCALSDTLRDA